MAFAHARLVDLINQHRMQGGGGHGGPVHASSEILHPAYTPDGPVDSGFNPAVYQRAQGNVAQAARDWLAHHPGAVSRGQIPPWVTAQRAAALGTHEAQAPLGVAHPLLGGPAPGASVPGAAPAPVAPVAGPGGAAPVPGPTLGAGPGSAPQPAAAPGPITPGGGPAPGLPHFPSAPFGGSGIQPGPFAPQPTGVHPNQAAALRALGYA